MGTETVYRNKYTRTHHYHCVKLNNPLMGTETRVYPPKVVALFLVIVKLNNPLMGTETYNSIPFFLSNANNIG